MAREPLLVMSEAGFYCPAGGFHIDPWLPVDRAIITHAHSDHARPGSESYLASRESEGVLRMRLGGDASIETAAYAQPITIGDVIISLHPAGHILGSAQVRIERSGEVWVMSGDYKLAPDSTCMPFEPVVCDTFISECTFGLPIYRWPENERLFEEINTWWRRNQEAERTSVIYAYALGKAQRVLAGLDPSIGPILTHGAVERLIEAYRAAGIDLPPTEHATDAGAKAHGSRALVIAPPSAGRTPWLRKFGDVSNAFVSGWMQIRGTRRRRHVDRGFVISDHADWDDLNRAIRETGASRIGLTHGYTHVMARWLREQGYEATIFTTRYEGELDQDPAGEETSTEEQTSPAEPALLMDDETP